MNYFRFVIPKNKAGSIVRYSPNWHGTMPRCPQGVKVLLYDDKVGFGIAQTEDNFMPPEVVSISKQAAFDLVNSYKDEAGVFFGEKLLHRWDEKTIEEQRAEEALSG